MKAAKMKMIGAAVAAVVLLGMGAVTWFRSPPPTASSSAALAQENPASGPQVDAMLEARTKGSPTAPVTIFELSDFQCPFCRKFWEETLPTLEAEYINTGKVRFIFINLPLASIHPNAPAAHEFAMCAAFQDRFWPVHDLLYQYQDAWSNLDNPGAFFLGLADSVALDRSALASCLQSGSGRPQVLADVQQAQRGQVTSTPTFVIDRGRLPGAAGIDVFRQILDSIIQVKEAQSTPGQ